MAKRAHNLDDMTILLVAGGVLFVGYQVYQTLKGIGSGVATAATAATTAASNFDQNIGLGPIDNFISGLFDPPSTTP